ncbi:ABC transporter substrate-binding protein [Streptomyces sp. NPDC051776]|uniref:ABC transporter substrate-binding protein n=1 Tax=Streptomyces sp. NPDC051776 TaxID=3155414 RepID=UPI00343AC5F4
MRSRAVYGVAALAVAVSALATGCGGGDWEQGGSAEPRAAEGPKPEGFPATVTDCEGNRTTFSRPPGKIVTSNASALEMLLRLGAGDKVIGTGFPPGKGTLPGRLDAQAQKVPVLGRKIIAKEKLLGSGADLYIDTFAHMGNMGAMGDAPTEEEFKAAGIKHVYLASTACAPMAEGPQKDLSGVMEDIERLGVVTGTADRAGTLVKSMDKKVSAVRRAVGDVPEEKLPSYFFFDYDAGTKQPMALCNKQVGNAVITQAGARNVFGSCDGDFKPVSWEDVVGKNPDWIQLAVRDRGSKAANDKAFADAETFLKENAATKGMKAVEEGNFLRIGSERTTIAGVANADTVQEIAAALHPGKVKAAR